MFQCNPSDPNTDWSLLLVVLVCLLHVPDEPTDRTYLESANSYRCEGVLGTYKTTWLRKYLNNIKPFLIDCAYKIYFPFIIREPTIGLDKKCQKHFLNRRQMLPTTTRKNGFIMLSSTTNENNGKFKQVYNNNGQWWNDFYTIKYA